MAIAQRLLWVGARAISEPASDDPKLDFGGGSRDQGLEVALPQRTVGWVGGKEVSHRIVAAIANLIQ